MNITWHKYTGEPTELSDKESYIQIKFNDLNAWIQEGWRPYKLIKYLSHLKNSEKTILNLAKVEKVIQISA